MATLTITVLIAGLALLWMAGDKTVRYAMELAEIFGMSSFVFGFLVMSVSTGLPEILTAIFASVEHASGLSVGDIFGSSLVNMTLILGVSAIVAEKLTASKEDELSLLKILGVVVIVSSAVLITAKLSVVHGIILLLTYAICLYLLRKEGVMERVVKEEEEQAREEIESEPAWTTTAGTLVKFLITLTLVMIGARLTVQSAVSLAEQLGISMEVIGATIVAIGTGLPELTLELNAVKRKEYSLALGDIFGSTLVNLTLVLGLLSVISPTPIDILPLAGTIISFVIILAYIGYVINEHHGIPKKHGWILVIIFLLYLLEEAGIAGLL